VQVAVLGFVLVPVLVLVDALVYVPVPLLVEVPVLAVPCEQLPELESQHRPLLQVSPVEQPPIESQ
jgi:hypothetical protein